MLEVFFFLLLCLSYIYIYIYNIISPLFFHFFVFKIPKDEVCFSISFKKNSVFFFKENPIDYICSYPCNFLGVWFTFFKLAY
jgi:hypothetical protein